MRPVRECRPWAVPDMRKAVSEDTLTVRDTANQRQKVDGLLRDVTQVNDAICPIYNKKKMQGQDVLAGASGAVVGEAMGYLIAQEVYKKDPWQLDETEKQTVAALSTLASGLAGALAGNSTEAVATAAKAGQTTVENNFLGGISRGELEQDREALAQNPYTKENAQRLVNYEIRDQVSDELLAQYYKDPSSLTPE